MGFRKELLYGENNAGRKLKPGKTYGVLTAVVLGAAMAVCAQPLMTFAGPSEDSAAIQASGPSEDGTNSKKAAGPGSGTAIHSGSDIRLPLKPAEGFGASAVTGGLAAFYPLEEESVGAIARGIDVSYWNQNIDWAKVASDRVQFAVLATRFRGMEDPFFSVNADAASKAGIRLGAYIYSYATSEEMAEQEADFILNLIKDYPISFPVAFDAEDADTLGQLSPDEVSRIINAFCRKVEAAGYYPMVYANEYWINHKIDMSALNYDIWVARYQERFTYDSPAMWQASNTGSVSGIEGNVDINYLYKDYTQVIPANTWRIIGGNRYYYKDHVMQRSAWIHDGMNWYYMNSEGTPSYGWQEIDGFRYLLDTSGAMVTGWRDDGAGLYYLDETTGALAVNTELEYNGARYQAGADGICILIPEAAPENGSGELSGDRAAEEAGAADAVIPQTPSGPAGTD